MTIDEQILQMARRAEAAARCVAALTTQEKNRILAAMAGGLGEATGAIKQANARDLEAAEASGLAPAMLDRLGLDNDRIADMAEGMAQVAALPDPVGAELERVGGLGKGRDIPSRRASGVDYDSHIDDRRGKRGIVRPS